MTTTLVRFEENGGTMCTVGKPDGDDDPNRGTPTCHGLYKNQDLSISSDPAIPKYPPHSAGPR